MVDVMHDTDNGITAPAGDFDLLAQWFTIRKESSRRSLIDDHDAGGERTILSLELPASQQSHPKRLEVPGARHPEVDSGTVFLRDRLPHFFERKVIIDTDRIHR